VECVTVTAGENGQSSSAYEKYEGSPLKTGLVGRRPFHGSLGGVSAFSTGFDDAIGDRAVARRSRPPPIGKPLFARLFIERDSSEATRSGGRLKFWIRRTGAAER